MKNIHLICAARPNFMKIAPLYKAMKATSDLNPVIVHTGQHYSYEMSQAFFDDLGLPEPDHHLDVGSGTHAFQTGETMIAYEELCEKSRADLVVVVGDVNATAACTMAAKKLLLPVAHLEAGLRSLDRTMPEEINRIVTDSISDWHWTPSADADENLIKENIRPDQIRMVGNIMIDSLVMMKHAIDMAAAWQKYLLDPKEYGVLTLHRPVNVDDAATLARLLEAVAGAGVPMIFPVHPRTRKVLDTLPKTLLKSFILTDPLSYVQFISLVSEAKFVVTDSGGIQEETTYLNIPCHTLRETTERPITVTMGTNRLVKPETLAQSLQNPKTGSVPPLWDGNTASRVIDHIREILA